MRIQLAQQLRLWADELDAIANEGLSWSGDDPYQRRRFGRVQRLAAEVFAAQDVRDVDEIERVYRGDLTHLTPYAVGDAAVWNERGELLLIQRVDDQRWAMPGGMFEVGETPSEGACREAHEETGLHVEALALIGVYDSRLCGALSNHHLYQFVFACRPRDRHAQPVVTNESLNVGWFTEASLPLLSPGHDVRVPDAFRFWRGELEKAVFN